MKLRSFLFISCTLLFCIGPSPAISENKPHDTEATNIRELNGSFVAHLTETHRASATHDDEWFMPNYSFPSPFYRTGWVAENIRFTPETMDLSIYNESTEHQPYSGAEYQRRGWYHYGRYEVIMKPIDQSGLVSSFFVYTGTHYDDDPHHEIDIEFVGRDTTKMHPNMFINGDVRNPPKVNLGFDASDSFNLYAFEWEPERITWFVNDQKVLTLEAPYSRIPQAPGIVMVNLWTGSEEQYAWHGTRQFEDGASSQYKCISFRALGDPDSPQCSDSELMSEIG